MSRIASSFRGNLVGLIVAFISLAAAVQARGQACQRVTVNCISHRIAIDGWQPSNQDWLKIDCGKNTQRAGASSGVTYSGVGYVGATIATVGNAITSGIDIGGIDGMGVCGGRNVNGVIQAAIFHTRPSRKIPQGADVSNGCIHVSESVMNYLDSYCRDVPLEIKTPTIRHQPPATCGTSQPDPQGSESPGTYSSPFYR